MAAASSERSRSAAIAVSSAMIPPRQSTTVPKTSKASTCTPGGPLPGMRRWLPLGQDQVGAIDRVVRMSQDVQQSWVHRNDDAVELIARSLDRLCPGLSVGRNLDSAPVFDW